MKDLRGYSRKEQAAVMQLSKVHELSGSKHFFFEFSVTQRMQRMEHAVVSIVEIPNRHDRAVSGVGPLFLGLKSGSGRKIGRKKFYFHDIIFFGKSIVPYYSWWCCALLCRSKFRNFIY